MKSVNDFLNRQLAHIYRHLPISLLSHTRVNMRKEERRYVTTQPRGDEPDDGEMPFILTVIYYSYL